MSSIKVWPGQSFLAQQGVLVVDHKQVMARNGVEHRFYLRRSTSVGPEEAKAIFRDWAHDEYEASGVSFWWTPKENYNQFHATFWARY